MNKFILALFFLVLSSVKLVAQENTGVINDLLGVWQSENKKQNIKVFYSPKTKKYYGKIVYMYEDDWENGRKMFDVNNPNPKLRSRRITGINLLYGFEYKGKDEFKGYIYDPISGKSYNCNLKIMPDRKTAEIRGYIFVPWIGRTEIATKIQ